MAGQVVAHQGDFLGLFNDDPLGQTLHGLVLPVQKLDARHVDGALVMRDHHGGEVHGWVAGGFYRHVAVHPSRASVRRP